jgi:hypothetical protein
MRTKHGHELADQYMRRLRRSASTLSRRQRDELLAEVGAHIAAGLAETESATDVQNMLEALGEPDEVVAAASPGPSPAAVQGRGTPALVIGIVAFVVALIPFLGLFIATPLGCVAVIMGDRARRKARLAGAFDGSAVAGVALGFIAIVCALLLAMFLTPGEIRSG